MGLDLTAENLLLLVYVPSSSIRSGNLLDNQTLNMIVKPEIGSSIFIAEILHAGYYDNDDVDYALLGEICQDTTHFVTKNFVKRVQFILQIRSRLQVSNVGWVGGGTVATALTTLIQTDFNKMEDHGIEDLYTGHLGYLLLSAYHPSRPLNSKGDPTCSFVVRRSLSLFKLVQEFFLNGVPFTRDDIERQLSNKDKAHRRMYDRTHTMLTYIIGPSLLNQVLEKKRSLLHHDSTQLLAALDFISNTEFFLTMDDEG